MSGSLRRFTPEFKVDAHKASDEVNGALRIPVDLWERGEGVVRKAVAKTMRDNGIQGISPPGGDQKRCLSMRLRTRSRIW
ncbi:hypothetical protein IEU95_15995 [Hoyosella rhizosphaerae]|uniref:Uncharacterized protein n=1 Tax=Hoyosella rhizosphaerae TaxID=1755582 RepID=A0A916UIH4_9ACTN|nr:hypothetical protein [Hoyosella rhizosphaerae]MBN4928337.1 hypothetical protein [Hoyosella rhizosphaerae]GGC74168.1 hypothetical protein GCM10011410_29260 [Hoyosella rhizosphaerae]